VTVDRDAVHAYPIKGRIVALGVNVLSQDPTDALLQRPHFERQGHEVLRNRQLRRMRCDRRRGSP